MATIFAWTGALRKRGELDGLDDLVNFADRLEKATLDTIEAGEMTGDLARITTLENPHDAFHARFHPGDRQASLSFQDKARFDDVCRSAPCCFRGLRFAAVRLLFRKACRFIESPFSMKRHAFPFFARDEHKAGYGPCVLSGIAVNLNAILIRMLFLPNAALTGTFIS